MGKKRTKGSGWALHGLLLLSCGRTELAENSGFGGAGGAGAGTLVAVSGGGQGSFGNASTTSNSSSVSTNSTSNVVGTAVSVGGVTTRGDGGNSSTDGQPTSTGGAGAGTHSWDGPVLLETNDLGGVWGARIAMNDSGTAVVAMTQDTTLNAVWGTLYTPEAGWSEAELLRGEGNHVNRPEVAIDDDGGAVVVWNTDEPAPNLWASRYRGRRGWQAPEFVNLDGVFSADSPDVAMDAGGTTVAVWRELDGLDSVIWSNRYTTDKGWGSAVPIQESNTPDAPELAMNRSGNSLVVWAQVDNPGLNIWSSASETGTNWSLPERVPSGSSDASSLPEVAMDPAGNGVAVWHQHTASGDRVWGNRFVPGIGWTDPVILDAAPLSTFHAQVGMDGDGNAAAVWVRWDGTLFSIWSNHYSVDSGWGEAEQISSIADWCDAPELAVGSAGDAVAVWAQFDDDGATVVRSNRYTPGVGWLEPEFIDVATPGPSGGVDVGIDGEGNAIAVWSHSEDGGPFYIWANRSSRPE